MARVNTIEDWLCEALLKDRRRPGDKLGRREIETMRTGGEPTKAPSHYHLAGGLFVGQNPLCFEPFQVLWSSQIRFDLS
jgi:hypothetical protein